MRNKQKQKKIAWNHFVYRWEFLPDFKLLWQEAMQSLNYIVTLDKNVDCGEKQIRELEIARACMTFNHRFTNLCLCGGVCF